MLAVDRSTPQTRVSLRRIIATVALRPEADRQAMLAALESEGIREDVPAWLTCGIITRLRENTSLELSVALRVELSNGQVVHAGGSFRISVPRPRSESDRPHQVRQSARQVPRTALTRPLGPRGLHLVALINQMLGRTAHSRHRAGPVYAGLLRTLHQRGIETSEEALIALPLDITIDHVAETELLSWDS